MPDIDGILPHAETIFFEVLAELRGPFTLDFAHHRQIKHYEEPHDMIGIKSVVFHWGSNPEGVVDYFVLIFRRFRSPAATLNPRLATKEPLARYHSFRKAGAPWRAPT